MGTIWLDGGITGTRVEHGHFPSNPHALPLAGSRNTSLVFKRPLEPLSQCRAIERLGEIRNGPALHNMVTGAAARKCRDEDNWYF
jgi:hypothetical protein